MSSTLTAFSKNIAANMSAENDNKPLEEVKAPEVKAEETQEVCAADSSGERDVERLRMCLG